MTIHQNIHPSYDGNKPRKWEKITASFNDSTSGACVILKLEDQGSDEATICLHYSGPEYAHEFVDKLKAAVLALPDLDNTAEKNPAGFAVPPWGKDA